MILNVICTNSVLRTEKTEKKSNNAVHFAVESYKNLIPRIFIIWFLIDENNHFIYIIILDIYAETLKLLIGKKKNLKNVQDIL